MTYYCIQNVTWIDTPNRISHDFQLPDGFQILGQPEHFTDESSGVPRARAYFLIPVSPDEEPEPDDQLTLKETTP
jgi:hypothetical protein